MELLYLRFFRFGFNVCIMFIWCFVCVLLVLLRSCLVGGLCMAGNLRRV